MSAFVGGLLIRILNLGGKSLWLDEAFAIYVAKMPVTAILLEGADPVHPPLFFLILHFWGELGNSEFLLRLIPVLCSVIAILPIYIIGKELFNQKAALTTILIYAFNPLIIWYAQELRMYSLFLLLGACSTAALLLGTRPNQESRNLLYLSLAALFSAGVAYTHYAAFLFVYFQLLLIVVLIAYQKRTRFALLAWGGVTLGAIFLYLPWIMTPYPQTFYGRLLSGSGIRYYVPLLTNIIDPSTNQGQNILAGIRLSFALLIPCVIYLVASRQRVRQWVDKLFNMSWLNPIMLLGFGLFLLVGVLPRGYTVKRHLLIYIPFMLLVFGFYWPLVAKNRLIIGSLLLCSIGASLINNYLIPKTEWRDISNQVTTDFNDQDIVILNPHYLDVPFEFYNQDNAVFRGSADELKQMIDSLDPVQHVWYIEQEVNPDYRSDTADSLLNQLNVVDEARFTRTTMYQLEKH